MTQLVELTAGPARLVLAPELGGAIARLDVGDLPVLRPWSGDESSPFSLASNVLVPFSNRISGGGFEFHSKRYEIAPNLSGEPCPIHGDGFQRPWAVAKQDTAEVILTLEIGGIGPFHYLADQVFYLSETSLRIDLSLTNTGGESLPFGCGFHPWFPRDAGTKLCFAAKGAWMEDADYLPTELLMLDDAPDWDFADIRALPDHWINNAYTGWDGSAEIVQGDNFVSVRITASPVLDHAIVHSTGKTCDFFCFEPVSHAVDAVNQTGYPGLTVLAPGQLMAASMVLDWSTS